MTPRHSFDRTFRVFGLYSCAYLLIVLFSVACGGGSPGIAPSFTTQPMSQSIPVGQIATFSAIASGTAPLHFQWSKGGIEINGATGSSYMTPAVMPTDSGSSFTVTVTNNFGSATSNAALLTALPRAPLMGDWRFQGMDTAAGTVAAHTNIVSFSTNTIPNSLGTPLVVGLQFGDACGTTDPLDCAWLFSLFSPPVGTTYPTTVYSSDLFSNLESDLSNLETGKIVVTSFDLEEANQTFAVGYLETSEAGFQFASETVSPNQLQATAIQLGAGNRVITALSYDAAGNVFVISYGWQADTATKYEAQAVIIPSTSTTVATASSTAIAAAFTSLADQGYIITAMGGNASNGLLIVGTRVLGDVLPRPIQVSLQGGNQGQVSSALQPITGNVLGTIPSFFVDFSEQ
jgi:hypothetical protein